MKKVLLVYPEFSPFSFWNYKEVCKLVGAKYSTPPLGMITVAALLPKEWELKLIDMNANPLNDKDIEWADLVFIGGMITQQSYFIDLMDRIHSFGKKIVAGGPGPSSQPHLYKSADYIVLGEAENSIHQFIEDIEKGVQKGIYKSEEKPDMTISPVPRFDLINFNDYLNVGIQFCRGCPYNCEFCDVIELYGRKTRAKTKEQIIKELDTLYNLGYRGDINFVDDNFIGNKVKAKELLLAIKEWSIEHNYPYYYSTEASINIADDDELLSLMRDIDFKMVFIGIETTDEDVLKMTKKKQNTNRILSENISKIQSYGITVTGGFIYGFDNEAKGSSLLMAEAIAKNSICIPMIGLLYAMPNTQLTKRLEKENRLFQNHGDMGKEDIDQATSGINFITKRSRIEILKEYLDLILEVYSIKNYFNRCLKLGQSLKIQNKFKPSLKTKFKYGIGFVKTIFKIGLYPSTFYYYWRNLILILITNFSSFSAVVNNMAMFLHFRKQKNNLVDKISKELKKIIEIGEEKFYQEMGIKDENKRKAISTGI